MTKEKVENELKSIKDMLDVMSNNSQEFLNIEEASNFLKISKSSVYKLTHFKKLKFSKPNGKKIIFKRIDLVNFIENGFSKTQIEYSKLADELTDRTLKKRK